MGFMGLADGGRIKVAVNWKSSAEFMREKEKKKQCKYARIVGGFCFKSTVEQKTQLIHCVNYGLLDFSVSFCGNTKNAPQELHKRSDFIQLAKSCKL